jgi:hypothetical protein
MKTSDKRIAMESYNEFAKNPTANLDDLDELIKLRE